MIYYRRWPADYANDTRHLNFMEHGAYTIMLDILYATEKPLPLDDKKLIRLAGCRSTEECECLLMVRDEFFLKTSTGWTHKRYQRELNLLKAREIASQMNGRKGGRPANPNNLEEPTGLNLGSSRFDSNNLEKATPDSKTLDSRLYTLNKDLNSKTTSAPAALSVQVVTLPNWLSFVQMRKKIGKPLTNHAAELVMENLEKLKEQGEDPDAVLEQSIMNGWSGVFPLKEKKGKSNGQSESFDERKRRESHEAISAVRDSAQQVVREMGKRIPDPKSH